MTLTPQQVRDAVGSYYAAIRSGDVERVVSMFAAEAVLRDPVGIAPATDDGARRQRYAGIGATFASFAIDEDRIIVCGDEAAVTWRATGVARNGKHVSFDGISVFVLGDVGTIVSMSAYYDIAAVVGAMAS